MGSQTSQVLVFSLTLRTEEIFCKKVECLNGKDELSDACEDFHLTPIRKVSQRVDSTKNCIVLEDKENEIISKLSETTRNGTTSFENKQFQY